MLIFEQSQEDRRALSQRVTDAKELPELPIAKQALRNDVPKLPNVSETLTPPPHPISPLWSQSTSSQRPPR